MLLRLIGLGVGDNNCMWVEDSSAHHCDCMVYGSLAMVACWVLANASLMCGSTFSL